MITDLLSCKFSISLQVLANFNRSITKEIIISGGALTFFCSETARQAHLANSHKLELIQKESS